MLRHGRIELCRIASAQSIAKIQLKGEWHCNKQEINLLVSILQCLSNTNEHV